jgi:4-amino-4-deoxy-L-arabinose transferase-like glycosyltransferase
MFERRPRGGALAIVLVCLVLGIVLRFTGLSVQSMWYDEGYTAWISSADNTIELLKADRHPPLTFLAFGLWSRLFGSDDAVLRVLPALVSSISLVLFAALARRLLAPRAATIAVALYAVSPFAIWIGQEVRMYAFVEFGALLALLGVHVFVSGSRAVGWISAAAGTAIALGSHYYGGLIGASIVAIALASIAFGRIGAIETAAIASAPLVALAAWTPWLVTALPGQMHTGWAWQARMSVRDFVELPSRFVLVEVAAIPDALQWTGYAIAGALTVGFLLAFARAARALRLEHTWVLLACVTPIATALALALFVPPSFSPRYLVTAEPAAVMLIAIGLDSIEIAPLRAIALSIAIGGAFLLACWHKTGNRREDYRGACSELVAQWHSGDALLVISGTPEVFSQAPVRHYLRDHPEIADAILDWPAVSGAIKAALVPHQRVHVIHRQAEYSQDEIDALKATLPVVHADPRRFRMQHLLLQAP